MIRFGFWTDTHARFETPEERTDNFFQSLLLKLEEVGQIFKDEKVDYTLFGGDLYDSDTVAKSVITGIQTVLRAWQLPIIGVVGSHDYIGYQMKSLKSTALGITESAGIIDIIGGYGHPHAIMLNNHDTKVNIVGKPHTYTFTDSKDNMYVEKDLSSTYQIQIVHADLNVKPAPWRHILVQDGLTDSDLVLSGHYHPGWEYPVTMRGRDDAHNVSFINPGSIARMKNTGTRRIPRVCIITVDGNQCTYNFIELKSAIAHPFAEKKVKVVDEDPMMDIQRFLDLIGGAEINAIDIKTQLPIVAKEYGFSEEVVADAFTYIDEQSAQEKK